MNKVLKKELEKCKISLPYYDDNTTHLIISRTEYEHKEESIELRQDCYYIIKLQHYIVHPPDNFTLSTNWNKGITPISAYLMGTPIKFVGKMVQWDACGYDIINNVALDDIYSGLWLPLKGFEVLEQVNN